MRTGLSPSMVLLSSRFCYTTHNYHHPPLEEDGRDALQHLPLQRLPAFVTAHTQIQVSPCLQQLHNRGLGCSRFARRYSGNGFAFRFHTTCFTRQLPGFVRENVKRKILFLFLWLLRCFTSPGALPLQLLTKGNTVLTALGFPIRKSSDQRLLATSPKLIAGCYVLHRHVLSSHPPYALRCSTTTPRLDLEEGSNHSHGVI